jgi:hypothetical protein
MIDRFRCSRPDFEQRQNKDTTHVLHFGVVLMHIWWIGSAPGSADSFAKCRVSAFSGRGRVRANVQPCLPAFRPDGESGKAVEGRSVRR